ncbi:MAG: hypothetical protein EXR77_00370 [Myxococcales bacterium]|nr:hypothetical protein [Myxococcales bacterium]
MPQVRVTGSHKAMILLNNSDWTLRLRDLTESNGFCWRPLAGGLRRSGVALAAKGVCAALAVSVLASTACVGGSSDGSSGPAIASVTDAAVARFNVDVGKSAPKTSSDAAQDSSGGSAPTGQSGDSASPPSGTVDSGEQADSAVAASAEGVDSKSPDSLANSQNCEKDKFCIDASDCPVTPCTQGQCKGGCCIVSPVVDGKTCDDSNKCTATDTCKVGVCTGKAKSCDDGKDCTADSCNTVNGKCVSVIADKSCLIVGKCVAQGEVSQASACKTCDPVSSTDSWTVAANCCADASECPPAGVCDTPVCDPVAHTCGFEKKVGCCIQDSDCSDANACTKDSCDVALGVCSYAAISCVDPNPCQAATCVEATGECKAVTKPGWCMVDGSCHTEGATSSANPCLVCNSAKSNTEWKTAIGTACSDSNPCTYGDSCQVGGKCVGSPQQGCCQSNADCKPTGDPCAANVCDLGQGLCISKSLAGCCTSGTCCDAATNSVKPAKSTCGGGAISVQYQCSGQIIQSQEISPGCNGASATGCSSQTQFLVSGPWQNVQTCPANTQCAAAGSGQKPTCASTQPAGSCANSCGSKSITGVCYCDAICTGAGDCCKDYMTFCGCASGECCDVTTKFPKTAGTTCGAVKTQFQCSGKLVQKRTGNPTCDGKNICATATASIKWGSYGTTQTCGSTQNCHAAADGSSASCVAIPTGTCMGHCGTKSTGSCYCDTACKGLGDCCADFDSVGCATMQTCGAKATTTCKGKCGGQGIGLCWCDSLCESIGDCCPDRAVCACN